MPTGSSATRTAGSGSSTSRPAKTAAAARRRRPARPARGLPAGGASRARSPSWPGPDARPGGAELVYLRLSDGPGGYPKVFTQASLDDVPFPLGAPEPVDDPGAAPPATWVHQRLAEAAATSSGPSGTRPGSDRAAATARSAAAARPSRPDGRWCDDGARAGPGRPVDAAAHRRGPGRRARRPVLRRSSWTAITAPLEPGVIIAGAGSGKTTVMAARVVWLVGTGAVRPEEVLGLTFTRKAAAELSSRVRHALLRAGVVAESGRRRVR